MKSLVLAQLTLKKYFINIMILQGEEVKKQNKKYWEE